MTIYPKSAFALGRGAATLIFSRKIPEGSQPFLYLMTKESKKTCSLIFNYSPNKIRSGRRHTDCVRTQMVGRLRNMTPESRQAPHDF